MAVVWDTIHDPVVDSYLGYPKPHQNKGLHHEVHHFHHPPHSSTKTAPALHTTTASHTNGHAVSWTPDSDLRETKIAYHIEMELAGVSDKTSILIQWMSPRTLLVEGKATRPDLNRGHEGDGDAMWEPNLEAEAVKAEKRKPDTTAQDGGDLVRCPDTAEERTTRIIFGERKIGSWRRSFTLPADVDMTTLKARLRDGLLRISVFKRETSGESGVRIEIE